MNVFFALYLLQCTPNYNVSCYNNHRSLNSRSPPWSSRYLYNGTQDVATFPRSSRGPGRFHRSLWFRSLVSPTLFFLPISLTPSLAVHYYMNARNGDFTVSSPLVVGHEAAGIVTTVGNGVQNFLIGDRVAIEAAFTAMLATFAI